MKSLSRCLQASPNVSLLKKGNWGSPKRVQTNSLFDKILLNTVSHMAFCNLQNFGSCLSQFRKI